MKDDWPCSNVVVYSYGVCNREYSIMGGKYSIYSIIGGIIGDGGTVYVRMSYKWYKLG